MKDDEGHVLSKKMQKLLNDQDGKLARSVGVSESAIDLSESKIDALDAGRLVTEWIIQDVPKSKIVVRLNELYPEASIVGRDLDKFFEQHGEILRAVMKTDAEVMKRHLDISFAFRDKLLGMQELTHGALERAAGQDDYAAIASLHNAILKNVQLFAKLGGLLAPDGQKIEINITQQLAEAMGKEQNRKRSDMLEGARVVNADFEIGSEVD